MSRPEAKLVARLSDIPAVAALVSDRIFPLAVPQGVGTQLPSIVYQVLSDVPENVSGGTTETSTAMIRLMCAAAASSGESGYHAIRALADAVRGDGAKNDPSGLAGWIDDEGKLWNLQEAHDTVGEILGGQDMFYAYLIVMDFQTEYDLP